MIYRNLTAHAAAQIFIVPLLAAQPPIIAPQSALEDFIAEVFSNIGEIEKIHQRMVAALFRRQRKEHPIITTVSDIVLDAALSFQEQYEVYIKVRIPTSDWGLVTPSTDMI